MRLLIVLCDYFGSLDFSETPSFCFYLSPKYLSNNPRYAVNNSSVSR